MSSAAPPGHPAGEDRGREVVRQMRLVVEVDDLDGAVAFYRDALGLPEQAAFSGGGEARVVILDAGRATLELANGPQRVMIDEVEVGRALEPLEDRADRQGSAPSVTVRAEGIGPSRRRLSGPHSRRTSTRRWRWRHATPKPDSSPSVRS